MPELQRCAGALLRGSAAVLLLCLSAGAAAATDCDRMAGHKLDPNNVAAGISGSEMDMPAAEAACREAVAAYPAHARSNYQLGRVLYYMGRGKESLPFLEVAVAAGYPQAIFVLGFVKTLEDDGIPVDYCGAADLWLQSAALDHPWTGVYLPWEYLQGNFKDCDIELSDADLLRLEKLALANVYYGDSEGRIEAMQAAMDEHFDRERE